MMTITLELRPETETRLIETAARVGVSLEQYLADWIEQAPEVKHPARPAEAPEVFQDADLAKLIAETRGTAVVIPPTRDLGELLSQWRAEDATDDREELARRDAEWKKLKANLNANRAATGEEPLFLDDEQP